MANLVTLPTQVVGVIIDGMNLEGQHQKIKALKICTYEYGQKNSSFGLFMKQNESFQIRYCMTFYLKGHQIYQNSRLKLPKKSAFMKLSGKSKSSSCVSFDAP